MEIPTTSGKDYVPGDVIIKFEPQVHCITDECKSKFCDNCREKSDELKKCSKCRQMYYCGKDCQLNDWKAHKYECKVFRHPWWIIESLDSPFRLLLRWWLCYEKDKDFSKKKFPTLNGKEFCFDDIKVDLDEIRNDFVKMAEMYQIKNKFEMNGLVIDEDEFIKWFALKSKTVIFENPDYDHNNIRKTVSYINTINCGLAIIIQLSYLNHSCLPNSIKYFEGLTMELRAVKPIAKGEKITLSFIMLQNDKMTRQMIMSSKDMPECQCDKCRLNLDKIINYEKFNALHGTHMKFWLTLDNSLQLASYKEYKIDWQLIDDMKVIYGEYYPVITRSLVTSFIYFAENSRFASKPVLRSAYKKIEPHIRVTHGSEHPYYLNFKKFTSRYINV